MNSNSSSNNDNQNNTVSTRQTKKNQEKNKKEDKSPGTTSNVNYPLNKTKNTRKKTYNKEVKSQKIKTKKNKCLFSFESQVRNNLYKKYNFTQKKYNLQCVNYLLSNATCRLVSVFKEKMIIDYVDEFLKRKYNIKESKERIPKFYLYYKHYSIFFGQPFFTDFSFNIILQKSGEKKARIYYKNHYQNGESKDDDNENIGFAESGSDDEDEDKKNNEDTNKKKKNNKNNNNTIFNSCIKENIDNVTLMTTINSIENNTINLGLNNERIEIFSENKMEKSNDTTIGELMEDIEKGIEEMNKIKNKNVVKKKKKKNHSLGDNFYNLIRKNINSNCLNENIKKNKKKLIELLNNNNIKKKIKNNSIKKKLFYVGHQNINLNLNSNAPLTSNTHRYSTKKNNVSSKADNVNKKNINAISNNNNLNSNKTYKKRKLLSYGNEEVNKIINPHTHKSPKRGNNINYNYLNTINANTIYSSKKLGEIQKINSPFSLNKKTINTTNNTNSILTSINTNHNSNKIKICKTLKNFADKNKNKKTVPKNNMNKELITISGGKKRTINKFSYKKLELDNLTETQMFKEKHVSKKPKGRNIVSPLNNKYFENYTLTNEYTSTNNNLPFSANKNKNNATNNKIFNNNKVKLNNLSYQTINYEQGIYHQRTKSNLIQNNYKKNINSNPTFSKVIITDANNAYIKPAIRIKKNDKLYMSRPILIDTNNDNNYENKTSINNNKKTSNNNGNYLNNYTINNTNLTNEFKNNIIHNNNIKNTNFNKYILDVIKKSKHQHYNSLTSQMNPIHTLNPKDNMLLKKKKKLTNQGKGNKDRDVLQIALSLFVNENTSRNIQNNTGIMESSPGNGNNFNTYYKINNNRPTQKNQNNNQKRNYNLNININNEININENNTINNSTYSLNDTHRLNSKNISRNTGNKNYLKNYFGNDSKQKEKDKNIINLKQKKYNMDPVNNTNRNNNVCQSTKNNNINENIIIDMNKKGKKLKTRNYGNKNLNNILTSINNNYVNSVIINNNNNTIDNNRYIDSNKINITNNNNKNNNDNIIKSYHTKSVTSLSDLMYHNKRLISLYKNLSKSK